MRILSASFVKSAVKPEDFPRDGRPEVAFIGRSNVGKSSLLNTLLKRKGLAKTSATPGKTQTVNFFDINNRLYFVDLPGYGYAKVPRTVKQEWSRVMLDYLSSRKPLRLAVQLLDARHPPTERDLDMLVLLEEAKVPTLIVATKIDKLGVHARAQNLAALHKTLELDADALIIPFSAVTGEGVGPVWDIIKSNI